MLRFNFFYDQNRRYPFEVVELLTEGACLHLVYSKRSSHGKVSLVTTDTNAARTSTLHFRFKDKLAERVLYDVLESYINELETYRKSDTRLQQQDYVAQYGYGMVGDCIWHGDCLRDERVMKELVRKEFERNDRKQIPLVLMDKKEKKAKSKWTKIYRSIFK